MTRTILFIHGGWVTPACWEPFASFFEARGYRCLAPAWPGKDRSVEAIRADPSPLVGLGIGEIVDHYDRIVRSLDEPPILIGHSFGGLFVQMLLDRGLGAAGVAIDSAPPKGIFAFEPTTLLSLGRILLTPFGWRKVVRWSFTEFRYAFVHTLPHEEARAIWDAQIVPDSGRPFFQAAFSMLDRSSPARVDFANPHRAPLLFVAGEADRAMPPALVHRMYRAHRASPAQTDLRSFPGRTHWLIAQDGWEEVAQACLGWIESLSSATVPDTALAGPQKESLAVETRDSAHLRAVPEGQQEREERAVEPGTVHGGGHVRRCGRRAPALPVVASRARRAGHDPRRGDLHPRVRRP